MAYSPLSSLPNLFNTQNANSTSSLGSLGVQAKSPTNGLLPPPPTLQSSQVKTTATPYTQSSTQGGTGNGSIVDYLNSQGQASDYGTRAKLAAQYGISGYAGTATQNTQLLGLLRNKTAPPVTPAPANYGTSTSSPTNSGYGVSNAVPQVQQNVDGSTNLQGLTGQPTVNTPPPQYTPPNQGTTGVNQGGIIGNLINTAQNESPQVQQARQAYTDLEAQKAFDTKNTGVGTDSGFAMGKQGLINNYYATREAAAQTALQNALSSQGQGITAQNDAGTLNQPVTGVGYGTQVYDPSSGTFKSGGSAFQGGQIAGETALGTQYAQNASAYKQATGVKNNIVSFLNTTPINPSDFRDLNSVVGLLSGKVSDPKYQQLSSQLTEYLNTLAPILGVGGGDTNFKTQLAQGMLDGGMSPQAIVDQLNTIEKTAETKLQIQAGGSGTINNSQGSTGTFSGAAWK